MRTLPLALRGKASIKSTCLGVPRANSTAEDDVYLLDLLMTDDKAYLVIIDAATLQEKAKLHLPQRVPYGVRGCWLNNEQQAAMLA